MLEDTISCRRGRGASGVDAVLFDLYGTLVDIVLDETSPSFWEAMAARLESSRIEVVPQQLQVRYLQLCQVEISRGGHRHLLDRVFRQLLLGAERPSSRSDIERLGAFFRASSTRAFEVKPYAKPILAAIRRSGCRTGLISNTEAVLTRFDLRRSGLASCFDAIILSSEVGLAKPDPRVFRRGLDRLRVAPSRAVFVGNDVTADIAGAQKANLHAIFLNPDGPHFTAAGLLPEPSVIGVFPDLASVVNALEQFGWRSFAARPLSC